MQTRRSVPIQDEAPVAAAPIAAAALLAPTLSGTISSGAAVSLFTLDGAEIDTAKETWIVIHGWTQNPSSVSHVAHQVAAQRPGAQVLMLDWSAADTGDDAGTLDITPEVGAWAAGALADAGFPAGTVNLVSYSYGVYVATELANAVPGGVDVLVAIDPGYDAPGSAYDPATQGDLSANSKYSLSFYGDEVKGNIGVAQSADEAVTILGSNHNGAYWVVESLLDATDGDGGGADAFFNLSRLLAHAPAGWLPNQFNSSGDNTFGLFDAVLDTTTDGRMPTGIDAIVFTGGDDVVTLFGQALNAHALGGDDTVNGSAVADTLFGDAGADRLEGRDGADILSGGVGADTMIGGRGGDAYYVGAGDVVVEASGEGADSVFTAVNYVLGANVEISRCLAPPRLAATAIPPTTSCSAMKVTTRSKAGLATTRSKAAAAMTCCTAMLASTRSPVGLARIRSCSTPCSIMPIATRSRISAWRTTRSVSMIQSSPRSARAR